MHGRKVRSASDLIADARHAQYDAYHACRYAVGLEACLAVRPDVTTRALDVGESSFTRFLRSHYAEVWTLGWHTGTDQHITFDLNDAQGGIATRERFDLITFNEVIEHLHTAPETVLAALAPLLVQGGHMIIQTPNAAALNKRISLLAGRNPYERLRTDPGNPGHIRELTKAELAEVAVASGFEIVDHRCLEYAGVYGAGWRTIALPLLKLAAWIWPTFARSQQIVLRKA